MNDLNDYIDNILKNNGINFDENLSYEEKLNLLSTDRHGNFAHIKRFIYCYVFEDFKKVYVGLTSSIRHRDYEHRNGNKFGYYGPVFKFAVANKIKIPQVKILDECKNSIDAQIKEGYYCQFYLNKDYCLLNKAKTGYKSSSLGFPIKKWTKEEIIEASKNYKTKYEFSVKENGAYIAALKFKIINNLFDYKEVNRHHDGWWQDKEHCREEASKYKTRREFDRGSYRAYESSRKNNWLDDFFPIEIASHKPKGYWLNIENCLQEAKNYGTRSEFSRKNTRAYETLRKNKLLDKVFK